MHSQPVRKQQTNRCSCSTNLLSLGSQAKNRTCHHQHHLCLDPTFQTIPSFAVFFFPWNSGRRMNQLPPRAGIELKDEEIHLLRWQQWRHSSWMPSRSLQHPKEANPELSSTHSAFCSPMDAKWIIPVQVNISCYKLCNSL